MKGKKLFNTGSKYITRRDLQSGGLCEVTTLERAPSGRSCPVERVKDKGHWNISERTSYMHGLITLAEI